jgi:N-acetylneuraminic acid mutarotase
VGLGGTNPVINDFWSFNSSINIWLKVADFPALVSTGVGLSVNGKGYVVCGNSTNNFYEYDPVSDIWTAKMDYPGSFTPDAGFVINDKLYIYAVDKTNAPNQLWEYNPANDTWTRKADQTPDNSGEDGSTGFSVNGIGYIRDFSTLLMYDPVSDSWIKRLNDGLNSRKYSIAFVLNNKAYFGTSIIFSSSTDISPRDIWEIDPNYE